MLTYQGVSLTHRFYNNHHIHRDYRKILASSIDLLSQSQTACEAAGFFRVESLPAAGDDDDDLALAIVTASKYASKYASGPKVVVSYERTDAEVGVRKAEEWIEEVKQVPWLTLLATR